MVLYFKMGEVPVPFMELSSSSCSLLAALLEMLGQISLYVTYTTIAKL